MFAICRHPRGGAILAKRQSVRALAITAMSSLLLLGCGDNQSASGEVEVALNVVAADKCPSITSAVAAPMQTSVGGTIGVSATAVDPDRGETVGFSWSPAAQFANPSSATTSYLCTAAGRQTLTLTIADSRRPIPCTAKATLEVDCVASRGSAP
jgi:hypothetical protein